MYVKKIMFVIMLHENEKYLASIMEDSAIIAVSIYCYLIKYRAKQKHLLPFNDKNNELKEVLY